MAERPASPARRRLALALVALAAAAAMVLFSMWRTVGWTIFALAAPVLFQRPLGRLLARRRNAASLLAVASATAADVLLMWILFGSPWASLWRAALSAGMLFAAATYNSLVLSRLAGRVEGG